MNYPLELSEAIVLDILDALWDKVEVGVALDQINEDDYEKLVYKLRKIVYNRLKKK
jgi:hypothetical protein